MSVYGGKEMAAAFRTVRKNTIQIAEDIPESKYGFRASPDTRTIAQTLVHIAFVTDFADHVHGNRVTDLSTVDFPSLFQKVTAEEAKSRSKSEIIALLRKKGDAFASYLESLPDSFLAEAVAMPPGAPMVSRTRFDMLLGSKEHEMHHRGQLMLLERMVGIVPHLTVYRQAQQAARAQAAQQQKA